MRSEYQETAYWVILILFSFVLLYIRRLQTQWKRQRRWQQWKKQTYQGPRNVPQDMRLRAFNRSKGRCYICRREIHLRHPQKRFTFFHHKRKCGQCFEADHIHPYSKGGATVDENIGAACRRCNREKSDRVF